MSMRFPALLGATLAALVAASPVVAQDGSPAPSVAPSAAPAAASPAPSLAAPRVGSVRWAATTDRDVRRSGVLEAAVTLGEEVIALAPATTRQGQTVIRVLATGDGSTWTRRGRIPLTGDVTDLFADGTTLYATGWDEGATIWRSDDAGRTWAVPPDQAPFAGDADGQPGTPEGADILAITRGPAGLLAVGRSTDLDTLQRRAAAWRSADGLAWERLAAVATLPPFHALAADATTYVVVGSSITAPKTAPGADVPVVRWSTDGATWTDATIELGAMESIDGVAALPGAGFLAWGRPLDGAAAPAIVWASPDGRAWTRQPADLALAGADLAQIRSLEGGALVMAVGGRPTGAFSFPWLGDAWRRDRIRRSAATCVRDVASVRAILVAVGGTCGGSRQQGRAWTAPLEP
jgi:hypothetical protein